MAAYVNAAVAFDSCVNVGVYMLYRRGTSTMLKVHSLCTSVSFEG